MTKKILRGRKLNQEATFRRCKLTHAVHKALLPPSTGLSLAGGIVIGAACNLAYPSQAAAQALEVIDLSNLNGRNGFVIDATPGNFQALSKAGDMNGDGLKDIVIGNDSGNASYIFFGQPTTEATRSVSDLDGSNGFVVQGFDTPERNFGLGENVGGGGDVNGDGLDDVVLGARIFYSEGSLRGGQSYVVFGPGEQLTGSSINVADLDGQNGLEVRGVPTCCFPISQGANVIGDVNGDGVEDFSVGNFSGSPDGIERAGRAFVVFGRENTPFPPTLELSSLNGENGFAIYGTQPLGSLGVSTTGLGDINGDGIDDMAVGAPDVPDRSTTIGEAYIIFGRDFSQGPAFPPVIRPNDLDGKNGFAIRGAISSRLGFALGDVGDINGDGISDVLVGAYTASRSYVVFGQDTAEVGDFPALIEVSELDGTNGFELIFPGNFGWSVDGAGDFNGDRIDDAIIGAPEYGNFGVSLVLFGRNSSTGSTFPKSIDVGTLESSDGVLLRGAAFPGTPRGGSAGYSVAGLADVNGDSVDDVAVGDRDFGRTYVVFGRSAEAPPLIRCPGDINGDNQQDFAVLTQGSLTATVKDITGALVSTVEFDGNLVPVDMEVMEDINSNDAPELVVLGEGSVKAEVRDSLTGELLGSVDFDPNLTPIDLELVGDQSGNAIPELAHLGQGSAQVEVKDPLTGELIQTVTFNGQRIPVDLSVSANTGIHLAVLGDHPDPDRADQVEIRDLASGDLLSRIGYGKGWQVKQLELLADSNGNGSKEAAVLRVHPTTDAVNVLIKDTGTGRKVSRLGFDPQYPPLKMVILSDLNGNGSDEVVVLGPKAGGGNQKAVVKDGKTNELIRRLFFNKTFVAQDMDVCPDINGNGAQELVMLGKRESDGKLKAFIKDARTGELIGRINF